MYKDKLSVTDYENADSDYIWYDIETRFDKDWKARGLYRSDSSEEKEKSDYSYRLDFGFGSNNAKISYSLIA